MSNTEYLPIQAFTMKCRLYPNKQQKEAIENIFDGIRLAYNDTLYEMFTNYRFTKERQDENGNVNHFPDMSETWKASRLNELRAKYDKVSLIPPNALSGNNGIFLSDMKRSFTTQYTKTTGKESNGKMLPVEIMKANYITSFKPRMSYTYQEYLKKISKNDNDKVFFVNLLKVGKVKVRGWNQQIKFDIEGTMNFLDYCNNNPDKRISINVSKDNLGDYYISFKFAMNAKGGIQVFKKSNVIDIDKRAGIDVGKKTLATLSDGTAYENKKFKRQSDARLRYYNRKISKQWGYRNPEFLKARKDDYSIQPSKSYMETLQKERKLNREIARKRENWNHNVSADIIKRFGFIAIESLNVTGMFGDTRTKEQKDINNSEFIPKRYICREHDNTADAAMGALLQMIKYKAEWNRRECVEIGRWFPSSKTCSVCGYINRDLILRDRTWTCPECGTVHERDENASENILEEGWRIYIANIRKVS